MKIIFGAISLCLLTRGISFGQTSDKQMIIGRWRSEDDKRYEVVFTKDKKIDYVNKQIESSAKYEIKNDSLIVKDKTGIMYYSIDGLDGQYLSLMYLDRGNILLFKRVKAKISN